MARSKATKNPTAAKLNPAQLALTPRNWRIVLVFAFFVMGLPSLLKPFGVLPQHTALAELVTVLPLGVWRILRQRREIERAKTEGGPG